MERYYFYNAKTSRFITAYAFAENEIKTLNLGYCALYCEWFYLGKWESGIMHRLHNKADISTLGAAYDFEFFPTALQRKIKREKMI